MKATTVKEVLIAMRWIIANVGWCQGAYAKNALGFSCGFQEEPSSFCLTGANMVVEADDGLARNACYILYSLTKEYVHMWNDKPGRTKKQVLKLLDKAIEQAP